MWGGPPYGLYFNEVEKVAALGASALISWACQSFWVETGSYFGGNIVMDCYNEKGSGTNRCLFYER
jgi:hypothetical protein